MAMSVENLACLPMDLYRDSRRISRNPTNLGNTTSTEMPGKTPATLLTPFVFFSAELEQPAYPAFGAIWAAGSTYNAPVSKKAKNGPMT